MTTCIYIYYHCAKLPEDSINIGLPLVHILVLRYLFYAKIVVKVVDWERVKWFYNCTCIGLWNRNGLFMHLIKFSNTYLILLGVSLNTDSICQISFEKSELCMFEGESDFWVKFGTIERGRWFIMGVMWLSAVFYWKDITLHCLFILVMMRRKN